MSKNKGPKPLLPYKVGRLKREEEDYIISNGITMTPADIAKKLNRSERQVLSCLSKIKRSPPKVEDENKDKLRKGLKESAVWKSIRSELENDELVFFEEQYVSYMDQFAKEEVLPTEENQIFKVINFDILKHRNAIRQKRCMHEIERCERLHEALTKSQEYKNGDSKTYEKIDVLDQKIQNLYSQQASFATEYVKLEEKHQKLMESLKATREARIDKIQSGKIDFLGLLRSLGDESVRDEQERYIELMRKGTKNEVERLSKPYIYSDGEIDIPLLNENSLLDGSIDSYDFKNKEN